MSFTSSNVVLVTGANGHVGQHVLAQLLSLPESVRPHVRAAVRSASSGAPLQQVFAESVATGHLELVFVSNIVAPGAYDAAVRGCTHIAHIASPLVLAPSSIEDDLLQPAIQGTLGLLKAAHANAADTLQSVVITSSFAAAFDPFAGFRPGYRYSGKDWSPLTYAQGAGHESIADGALSDVFRGFVPYLSSKKLAEAAAWDFYREAAPAWRFCTILPTYIGGPCVVPLRGKDGTDGYSFSQKILTGIALDEKVPKDDFPSWIDVRDVARAHIAALTRVQSAGRWILSTKMATMMDLAQTIKREFPTLNTIQTDNDDALKKDAYYEIGQEDAKIALGIEEWIGLDQMVRDTIQPVLDHCRQ